MCWELTGARELRNSDFQQIFPVLLTPVSVSVTAEELLHAGPAQYVWEGGKGSVFGLIVTLTGPRAIP